MADNDNQNQNNLGLQFEDILPWGTPGGDTGLSSRLKLKRNFEKILARFSTDQGRYLSKVSDDTAQGMITFLRGLQVGERFVTGLLGEGGVFRVEDDGTTYIEADKLYIRMKAYFDSVEIREYHHTGGNRIASVAGARCCRVEWIDSQGNVLEKTQANLSSVVKFRCYFMGNDGEDEVRNNWVVGDLAYCHITTVETEQSDNPEAKGLNMRHYWRKVVGRNATGTLTVKGEHWIDLSNVSGEYQSGSDVPVAQDDIIQLGNVSDGDRQGAIIEFVTGANAPSYQIFQHINSFSLNEKNFVNLGYDSQNNTAQAFIGNPDKSTYLWYHNVTVGGQTFPRLEIKANVQFTSPESSYGTQDLNAFISAVTGDINNIHDQIDGTIETWFYDGEPTLNNLPASQWTSSTDKDKHLGDLYYDNQTGYGYRFAYDESVTPAVYKWIKITDVDVVKALADAAKAQDTADHKRRVFVAQPAPVSPKNYVEYDIGDLWVNATHPSGYSGETDEANHKYNNDCLRCITAKPIRNEQGQITDGNFSINDWQLASKYTDDTELRNFLGDYEGTAEDLKQQIDKKAETWYQDEDPSLDWYVVNPQTHEVITDVRSEHVGDLWYCTAPVSATPPAYYDAVHGGNKTWQYKYNESTSNYYWAYQNVPMAVFDRIDGKAQLFVQIPNVANPKDDGYCYRKDDMWILESDNIHSPEMAGELMVATQSSTSYNSTHWIKKLKYTDDLDNFKVNQYVQALTSGNISLDITNASNAAQQAKQAADDAQADADAANTRLNNWADDGKISPTEKTALKQQWEDIKKEYLQICADATRYNVSTTNFDTAYTNANNAFTKYTASTPENITIDADYANIAAYYSARQTILDSIASAAKTYAGGYYNDTVLSAIKTALGSALGASTLIDGGLMLTSMMFLRQLRKSGGVPLDPSIVSNYTTWAGVSGEYNDKTEGQTGWAKGNGIAAWFGGDMVDFEMLTQSQQSAGWGTGTNQYRYAKSLFRFDGTGYLAGGNLTWDTNGTLKIGKTTNSYNIQLNSDGSGSVAAGNISWTTGGVLTIQGNSITAATELKVAGSDVLTQTTADARYVTIDWFRSLFRAYNSSDTELTPNGSTTGLDSIKAMVGFWTESYISALGQNSGGGGGITLNEPLLSINQAGLSAPTTNGSVLVYNNGWKYSNMANIFATGITVAGTATAAGFSATGKNDTYVLLAGGGTKLLSEIGGGGSVVSVSINGTSYSPDANGDVNLGSGYLTGYTDTKTTAGISQSSSKLYIIGSTNTSATAGTYGTTYTNTNCYIGTDGCLYSNSSKVATASDVANNYLSLSGGTLTSSSETVLHIKTTYSSKQPYISFKNSDGTIGYIGCDAVKGVGVWVNAAFRVLWNEYNDGSDSGLDADLLDGQHGSYYATASSLADYLPLSGGVINGSSVEPFAINNKSGASTYMSFRVNNSKKAYFGYEAGGLDTFMQNNTATGRPAIGILDSDGTPFYFISGTKYRIWNAYNYNLDKLYESGNYGWNKTLPRFAAFTWNKNSDNKYVIWPSTPDGTKDGTVAVDYAYSANAATSATKLVDGSTYMTSAYNKAGLTTTSYFAAWNGYELRAISPAATKNVLAINNVDNTADADKVVKGSTYAHYLSTKTMSGTSWYDTNNRAYVYWETGDKARLAIEGDYEVRCTAADKLVTSRTLWGQSFNGSANISGNMTDVGTLDASGYGKFGIIYINGKNNGTTNNGTIETSSGGALYFQYYHSGNINMCTGGGSLGIGKNPDYKLDVAGTAQFGSDSTMKIRLGTTSSSAVVGMVDAGGTSRNVVHLTSSNILYFGGGTGAAGYQTTFRGHKMAFVAGSTTQVDAMFISSAGKVMIGSSSAASYMLHVTGDIYATGGITALSDAREKNIIGNTMLTVEDIAMMKAVNYRWKDGRDNVQHVGSIAQDWQRVLPEVVMRADDEKGTLSLQYGVAALVSSIVTARKVVDHERRIAELERENRELKEKLKIA